MINILGLAIFAVGIVLLIFGFNQTQTVGLEISRVFSSPSDRTLWMLIGGAVTVIAGLFLALQSRRLD
jgi:multisubunit Na+/H+ antiporter MnhB subunit